MKEYLFHVEGLNKEIWSNPALSERDAYNQVFNDLTPSEQSCVVIMEVVMIVSKV